MGGVLSSDSFTYPGRTDDRQLWLAALGMALCLKLAALLILGFMVLNIGPIVLLPDELTPAEDPVATVLLEPVLADAVPELQAQPEKQFTRTSPEQEALPEQATHRIGERSTRATSDRPPDPFAPPLPSQRGIEPRDEQDIETTESDYQDGVLAEKNPKTLPEGPEQASPPDVLKPSPAADPAEPVKVSGDDLQQRLQPRERLLEGPNPVEVQTPKEVADARKSELPPNKPAEELVKPLDATKPGLTPADQIKASPPEQKTFSGFQRKTAVTGSISRSGRSALDVDDTELGRYQAQISRAVELEWQRNCVHHRDFITPGFLTVRFFVESSGRVKSVQFVGDMETGEVQKGFTLNSIRDADIPPMPAKLKQTYEDEPLELMFRFYF